MKRIPDMPGSLTGDLSRWGLPSSAVKNGVILTGVLFLVTLSLLLCALFFRGVFRARHRRNRSRTHSKTPDQSSGKIRRRSHRRRHRRERYPLNPTLSETGGLPPLRPPTETPSNPNL